jgi:hypothetical protein
MKIDLSFFLPELVGTTIVFLTAVITLGNWFFRYYKEQVLLQCKAFLYVLQERTQAKEIGISHLNDYAEEHLLNFRPLILSVRRRDIDEVR